MSLTRTIAEHPLLPKAIKIQLLKNLDRLSEEQKTKMASLLETHAQKLTRYYALKVKKNHVIESFLKNALRTIHKQTVKVGGQAEEEQSKAKAEELLKTFDEKIETPKPGFFKRFIEKLFNKNKKTSP